jgi:hypothetical protein
MTKLAMVNIIAGRLAVTLRWIIILVFPFNKLPESAPQRAGPRAEPDKVYNIRIVLLALRLHGVP